MEGVIFGILRYTESVTHVHSCCFALYPILPFSLLPPLSLIKLPIVDINFCYHGNVTSHFYPLLSY